MSSAVTVVAVLYPKEGKEARLKQVLADCAKEVEAKEKGTLRYHLHEEINERSGGKNYLDVTETKSNNLIIVTETYASKEAYEEHFKTPHFKILQEAIEGEELQDRPLIISICEPYGGFDYR